MSPEDAKNFVKDLLAPAGIEINGSHPWDIQVQNQHFYAEALRGGSLRIGETYVAAWWDCERLDEFFARVLKSAVDQVLPKNWYEEVYMAWARLFDLLAISRSGASCHYNLGNRLFARMLDQRLVYTCAYWKNATTLEEAQMHKLDLICKKLKLQPGMTVLDIGCGWGGLARYAAERCGAIVTGITLSREQATFAQRACGDLAVDIRLKDYRNLAGRYDRIVSLGMFEHVGYQHHRGYMKIVSEHLQDDGLFLLHTIGSNISATKTDAWINRYIFPNSLIPSLKQIASAVENLFVMEDWHNFSADYDKTLMAWYQNFVSHWDELRAEYDAAFFRMWSYYLLSCAGSFRARRNQLWQIVFSKHGVPDGYLSVR
jgi:cyclopropane-fatty-acyl-phospholipid synthase